MEKQESGADTQVSNEDLWPLGGIGVRSTPQSRYAALRTPMPRRGGGGVGGEGV
jgi:hypothetical protein